MAMAACLRCNGIYLAIIALTISMVRPTVSLLCYSSYFKEKYEKCDDNDYCFFLEDFSVDDSDVATNQARSCERRGHCRTLIENLKGKMLNKYGLVHKCGTFLSNETVFTDLCCCNFDWCNKLEVNEPPVVSKENTHGTEPGNAMEGHGEEMREDSKATADSSKSEL